MQTKFINITMKHLASKLTVVIFMSISFVSCSHIAHIVNKDHIPSQDSDEEYFEKYSEINPTPRKREYKKIYCTSEDEEKGIKTTIDYLHVACGLSKIQPINNRTLEIKTFFFGVEHFPDGSRLPIGHHLLILKSSDKVLQEMKVENEGYDPFWKEVVFVKIRKGVYWQDINNDGYPEFAVLKTDTGNAAYRTPEIYTLKNESFHFYGEGTYVWTTGEHVMFNCPKCTRHDPGECKKCT